MQPNSDQWQQPNITPDKPHTYEGPATVPPESPTTDQSQAPDQPPRQALPGEDEAVRWQGPEYLQREKPALWYVIFALVTVLLMALAVFLVRSITFSLLVPVMAAALLVHVRREPTQVNYTLSRKGLHVDDQLHPYTEFKEFRLINDDTQHAVYLVPRQRFKIGLTAYFPEEAGETIVDMLAARLPMRPPQLDPIDWLLRKLRI